MPVPVAIENFNMLFAPTLYFLALAENRQLSSCFGGIFLRNIFSETISSNNSENKLEKIKIFCGFRLT
jgi:hypothetical protein